MLQMFLNIRSENSKIQNIRYAIIYIKKIYTHMLTPPTSHKKPLGRITANSSSSWRGGTEGQEKEDTDH